MDKNIQKIQKRFIDVFVNNNGNISKTCKELGISRGTYYNWIKENDFKDSIKEIDEINIDFVESKLFELIDKGNITAVIYYLNNKGKKRGYNNEGADVKNFEPPRIIIQTINENGIISDIISN